MINHLSSSSRYHTTPLESDMPIRLNEPSNIDIQHHVRTSLRNKPIYLPMISSTPKNEYSHKGSVRRFKTEVPVETEDEDFDQTIH